MHVTVRYFAGARAAAGLDEERIDFDGADPAGPSPSVADLVELLGRRHGERLTRVLTACSFLLDEVAGDPRRGLHDGAQVDVLPPFAGG